MQTPSPFDAPPLLKQTPLDADPTPLDATPPPPRQTPLDADPSPERKPTTPVPRGRPPSMTDRNV